MAPPRSPAAARPAAVKPCAPLAGDDLTPTSLFASCLFILAHAVATPLPCYNGHLVLSDHRSSCMLPRTTGCASHGRRGRHGLRGDRRPSSATWADLPARAEIWSDKGAPLRTSPARKGRRLRLPGDAIFDRLGWRRRLGETLGILQALRNGPLRACNHRHFFLVAPWILE
jgi:hypothetical protein